MLLCTKSTSLNWLCRVESSEILHSASPPLLYRDRKSTSVCTHGGRGVLSWLHQQDAKNLKECLGLMQISQQLFTSTAGSHGWHRVSVIRVRPPGCHCFPVQSKNTAKKSKSEHVLLTHTHLKAFQTPKMCHCPPGYHAAVRPLTGDDAQSCRAGAGSQEALSCPELREQAVSCLQLRRFLRGWARLGSASSALRRSAELPALWHHGVPLGRKFQKRNKNLAAWPWPRCACSRPDRSRRAWTSRTQQARECICFSLEQLNAISIYIQMTAIQRERRFGWELGVSCITTLFRVSVYLCHTIPVKIPVEVNN